MTKNQIGGNQRRSLRAMRERLLNMAAAWDGVDQFNVTQLTELADKVEEVASSMVDDEALP